MYQLISKISKSALYWTTRLTPKTPFYVLRGFPCYEDNLIAIYEQLLERGYRDIIWVVDDPNVQPPIEIDPATRLVGRGSWRDMFFSIIAKYLFITHGHFNDQTPQNQICINLWHGIPYKVIGLLDGAAGRADTMVVATSELTQKIFAKSFGVPQSKVVITGQARTDRLFLEDPEDIRRKIFSGANQDTKMFLWLPTFRSTSYAGGRTDGQQFKNIFNCTDFAPDDFNQYLANHNSICFIKPHPMAPRKKAEQFSNIIYVDEDWLRLHRLSLYQLAGAADCLISDISSIIVDFMLLDRPIVLLFEDIADYEATRGFSFNPIMDWLPAAVSQNFETFMDEITAVMDGQDRYCTKRSHLKTLFFDHSDNQASSRILDYVSDLPSSRMHRTRQCGRKDYE